MELSNWFKGFEKGIAKLSEEQRERLSSASGECKLNCVKFSLHSRYGGGLAAKKLLLHLETTHHNLSDE